jgi:hypothetical protein
MGEGANVRSLEALIEFRAALVQFEDTSSGALDVLQQQIHRATDWFEHDRPGYWKRRIERSFNEVAETRTAYEMCRLNKVAGHRPACIEEKQAHEKAKRQLQHSQEQLEVARRWVFKIGHEVEEYRGRVGPMRQCLENDVPRMIGVLDRMIAALESYIGIRGPSSSSVVEDIPSGGSGDLDGLAPQTTGDGD